MISSQVTDINGIAEEVLLILAEQAREGMRLDCLLSPEPLAVEADPEAIRQILRLLVEFAIQAKPAGEIAAEPRRWIELRTGRRYGRLRMVIVEVAFDGASLPEEVKNCLRHSFPPLREESAGVQLLRAKDQVERLGGRFEVESPCLKEGCGARIRMLLRESRYRGKPTGGTRIARRKPALNTVDLALAEKVQVSMLPKAMISEKIEVNARCDPVAILGGDYAAVKWVNQRFMYLAQCDVCGHGIASAILANRVNSEVRHLMDDELEPWTLVDRLNRFVYQNYAHTNMFLTFACLRLDFETQTLLHAGAGHPPVLFVSADGGQAEWISSRNKLIGFFKNCLHANPQSELSLKSGDILVLVTDGVTETMNDRKEQFGKERLRQAVVAARSTSAADIADVVVAQATAWRSGPQEDDVLVLAARVKQTVSQASRAETIIPPPEAKPSTPCLSGRPGAMKYSGSVLDESNAQRHGATPNLEGCLEFTRDGSGRLKICDGAGSCRLIQLATPVEDLSGEELLAPLPRISLDEWKVPRISQIPLLSKLGEGAMASVYYGIHPRLGREVAVKILAPWVMEKHPAMVHRFIREAQMAGQVHSPNLVTVFDVNTELGLYFIEMEFVPGNSAAEYLEGVRANGEAGVNEAIALDICKGAARGLVAAHSRGIIHRDIKPENILLPRDARTRALSFPQAKLADLGIALSQEYESPQSEASIVIGTPGYMAPEQIEDAEKIGIPADVFGMGATLFALLSGNLPCGASSTTAALIQTVTEAPRSIYEFRPDVTQATAKLIRRCLRRDPTERYADSATLLKALTACRAAVGACRARVARLFEA